MKRINKFLKIFLIIFTITIILIAGSGTALYFFFPQKKVISIITEQGEKSLKRKLSLGKINFSLHGLVVNDIKLYNSMNENDGVFVTAENASMFLSLKALLHKQFQINIIRINKPQLAIEFIDNKTNIQLFLESLDLKKSDSNSSTNISRIVIKDASIAVKNLPAKYQSGEGTYQISTVLDFKEKNTKIEASDLSIILPSERGALECNLDLTIPEDKNFSIEGEVDIKNCELTWLYKLGNNVHQPYKYVTGKASSVKINKEFVGSHFEGGGILLNGKKITASGDWMLNHKIETLSITNTHGKIGSTDAQLKEIFVDIKNGSLIRLSVSECEGDYTDVIPFIPNAPTFVYGKFKGNLSITGRSVTADMSLINAGIKGNNSPVSDLSCHVQMNNNSFKLQDIPVKIMNNPGKISIATLDNNFSKFVLNASFNDFIINQKNSAQKDADASDDKQMKINIPIDVKGKIDVASLSYDKYRVNNIALNYMIAKNILIINSLQCQFLGSAIESRGNINFNTTPPYVNCAFSFENLKMQNLAEINDKIKNRFFGTGSGRGQLESPLTMKGSMTDKMKFKLDFSIDNGKLVDTGMQQSLGIWLDQLKFKLKDLEFKKIYGNINGVNNNFYINQFIFNSNDIRLKLDGYVGNDKSHDVNISLEFDKNFIQDIPNVARLLPIVNKHQRGEWYIIPFKFKGLNYTEWKNLKLVD